MSMLLECPIADEVEVDTSDRHVSFAPSIEEEAEALGYTLILDGEDPNPTPTWGFVTTVSFFQGVFSAWKKQAEDRFADREEYEAYLDSLPGPDWDAMYPDHDPHHPTEAIEAIGCVEARKGGGL